MEALSITPVNIYADALAPGWADWSYPATQNLANSSPVQSGTKSISVNFQSGWATFPLHNDTGISTAGYTQLEFYINGGSAGGQKLRVFANQNTNVVYYITANANTWTKISIPLTAFGSPATLTDIAWMDNTGTTLPSFYLDSINLTAPTLSTNTPTTAAGPTSTPKPSSTATKASTATQSSVATATLASLSTQYTVFADALQTGWADWSYPATQNLANTSPVQSGTKSISVNFQAGWATFPLHNSNPVSTANYTQLVFYIHGGTAGGQKLRVFANQNTGMVTYVTATANTWTKISIPLSAFGSPATITDLAWMDNTGTVLPTFYLDSISLAGSTSVSVTSTPFASKTSTATSTFLPTVMSTKTPTLPPPPAATSTPVPTLPPSKGGASLYSDALANGWYNWSWSVNVNFSNTSPVHSGSDSISASYQYDWGAVRMHNDNALDISTYTTLSFWINGGSTGGQSLQIQIDNDTNDRYTVNATANQWVNIQIPLSKFNTPITINDLYFIEPAHTTNPVYIDDVVFSGVAAPTPTPGTGGGPSLSVDAAANVHAISPDIYGMNWAPQALANELKLPVNRWGGNATSRYNYVYNNFNRAADWFFENVPNSDMSADAFESQDKSTGTNTILTVPMVGWIAKDGNRSCGFSVTKYGPQQSTDGDCGNGVDLNGNNITGNDPHDTSTPETTSYIQSWISHLISLYGTAANGGVRYYAMDNEPMLWNHTHRDVHPNPTSYDEMKSSTYTYAAAVKAADPSAKVLGPVLWGWTAYFYSAKDLVAPSSWQNPLDRNAHGGIPFVAWYLQQMKAYEQTYGKRILDYLDLHYYPQENNVFSNAVDSTTKALRLRSTRALWDPTYLDESWINDYVQLIPRMKQWVANNYPGTKTALTEYNWGALNNMNGALAQADILGIFGREGLDLATLWAGPSSTDPGAYAFRMYMNYDGQGHKFGDTSVKAASANQEQLSVYAATRSSDGALTLMFINKTNNNLTSSLSLANFSAGTSAQVYTYSTANLNAIVRQSDLGISGTSLNYTFANNSITLIVIPKK